MTEVRAEGRATMATNSSFPLCVRLASSVRITKEYPLVDFEHKKIHDYEECVKARPRAVRGATSAPFLKVWKPCTMCRDDHFRISAEVAGAPRIQILKMLEPCT